MRPTRLAILGATGSIGRQTLAVVAAHPDRFRVTGLARRRDVPGLDDLAGAHGARVVIEERDGADACVALVTADDVDLVVIGVPGIAALRPTLAALGAGKAVAIAAKEILVVAGHLVRRLVPGGAGERLRPIDSEHCALWQCLRGEDPASVARVTLTASGGPFRDVPLERLASVSPRDALRHPTWSMGPKVTVDSATLVNKAYEIVEARWLFDLPYERIGVAIHPQSLVHALVEFRDGSVKAQLAVADMRLPIQYALLVPERLEAPVPRLELAGGLELAFGSVEAARYPCFGIVVDAARAGTAALVGVNAADEIAVSRFLAGELPFGDIPRLLERGRDVATRAGVRDDAGLDAILALDAEVRAAVAGERAVA